MSQQEDLFLSTQLITYIGNKRLLLPHIAVVLDELIKNLNKPHVSSLDLFSGSGCVSRLLKLKTNHVYANDLESYSCLINRCFLKNKADINWLEATHMLESSLQHIDALLETGLLLEERWIRTHYAPKNEQAIQKDDRCFYTVENALFLDASRVVLHQLPTLYKELLLAPLLSKASVHVNTAGIFKGFYKNKAGIGQFGGEGQHALKRIKGKITLELPCLVDSPASFEVFQQDALALVQTLPAVDIAYLDPPYNQHPYGSNYFMLNAIATNKQPQNISKVSGIPDDWNRSPFNKAAEAQATLFEVVQKLKARYVVISYNSEGFISKEAFLTFLKTLGSVEIKEIDYNTFRGSRNLRERSSTVTEFLFILKKTEKAYVG
ncbi:MAG: DNA adenine methylase [Vampirovibrionales bacterium]